MWYTERMSEPKAKRYGGAWMVTLGAVLLTGAASCGPPKQADDATSAAASKPADDGTKDVKWEGATAEDRQTRTQGPPAGAAPPVVGGPSETRRTDQYDKDHTEIVLKRAARQVKEHCGQATDESGKPSGPWGKTTVSVVLGHNGHSKGATVPAPYDGKPTGRCTVQAFSNLTFPPWGGADTTVDWEVEIPQPGK
jgi:hypothetical protein